MKTKTNAAIYAGILDGNSPAFRKRFFSIGGGGGKSKQQSQSESKSETVFKDDFLTKLFSAFPMPNYSNTATEATSQDGTSTLGPNQQMTVPVPKFNPLGANDYAQFKGLEDMDFNKLEGNLTAGLDQKLRPVMERERARNREELGQSGLLTSPVAYAKGGALENLQNSYLDAYGKGATDIGVETTRLKQSELARKGAFDTDIMKTRQQELARKTGFDFELVKTFDEIYDRLADIVLRAGGTSTSRGSGSGSSSNAQARFGFLS